MQMTATKDTPKSSRCTSQAYEIMNSIWRSRKQN